MTMKAAEAAAPGLTEAPVFDLGEVLSGIVVRFRAGPTGLLTGGQVEQHGEEDVVFVLGGDQLRVTRSVDRHGVVVEGIRHAVRRAVALGYWLPGAKREVR